MSNERESRNWTLEDVLRSLRVSHSAGETLGNPYVRLDADLVAEVIRRLTPSETASITDNDKRWRFLEHGCQWVSWTPINGQTVSFDPRNVTGYAGDLNDMRGQADIEIRKLGGLIYVRR